MSPVPVVQGFVLGNRLWASRIARRAGSSVWGARFATEIKSQLQNVQKWFVYKKLTRAPLAILSSQLAQVSAVVTWIRRNKLACFLIGFETCKKVTGNSSTLDEILFCCNLWLKKKFGYYDEALLSNLGLLSWPLVICGQQRALRSMWADQPCPRIGWSEETYSLINGLQNFNHIVTKCPVRKFFKGKFRVQYNYSKNRHITTEALGRHNVIFGQTWLNNFQT